MFTISYYCTRPFCTGSAQTLKNQACLSRAVLTGISKIKDYTKSLIADLQTFTSTGNNRPKAVVHPDSNSQD